MEITTIKLYKETKTRLEKLRENRRESYDDLIKKVLYILNVTRSDPTKAKFILEKISDVRQRMIDTEKEIKEELKKKAALKKKKKVNVSKS